MATPHYDWACQKCGKANQAHTAACVSCGFDAYFKAADLPLPVPAPASETDAVGGAESRSFNWVLLFPEVLIVLPLALYIPYWSLRAIAQGALLAPLCALLVEILCVCCFVWSMQARYSWLALGSMLIFLFVCNSLGVFG